MWRALTLFTALLLGVGVYVLVTGGASAHAATPPDQPGPGVTQFGFALAAGAIVLSAVLMLSRPRFPRRR